jgi:hypothetical protein
MPIRINLLAEAQAAEEIRRRDPAKRAMLIAVVIVMAVLVWSGSLQMKLMSDNAKLSRLQTSLNTRTNEYAQILDSQQKLAETEGKLKALHRVAADRFLHADLLNALQRSTMEGVQLNRLRVEQSFAVVPEVKSKMVDARLVPGKPGSSAEKIVLVLEARDSSPNPGGESINRFKEALAHNPYFLRQHISTNEILLRNLSAPQMDAESGRAYVQFSFECRYPERVR